MTTNVLLTGAFGRVGTAIIDHLADRDEYEFTYLNRSEREEYDTFVADVSNYEEMRPAFDDQDAVIHLAGYPETDGTWEQILQNNIIGMQNTLQAARDAEVPKFIFGSTNHVVGMYEVEFAPELYEPDYELMVDQDSPRRSDSYYGTSKSFDEDLGRYYVENYDYPKQFYSLRICSVRHEEYDHPYGDAEHGADEGKWERGSPEYDLKVARMKAMWQSRRDLAQQVDCCLQDDDVEYDVFFGVSDNDRRWFSIEHGRDVIGYDPQDNGEEWDAPPEGN
ncbi:NAD dependent epimerase/dehydratase family protein [Haladaptatus litoreus]|uniref:NAD dependent epimerase/dehydratase family protein n=1 Tax=Haladaptatus litoreus TaxID=553468 RepID=A0A1N7CLK0_9EURY|nr:NAD(P)-dependent oxidoreductase [Haladaptatus litoreus]SIR64423.1 NAD dependent epimerase/dehydratase family protein [Haladaptatus litoreus]